MATETKPRQRHHIRKFTTERKVNGGKQIRYAFSCTPCGINGAEYGSRKGRDKAVDEHNSTKTT